MPEQTFAESLVAKNLRILHALEEDALTLEELADATKFREGTLGVSLLMLRDQGLITVEGDVYYARMGADLRTVLRVTTPWMSHFDDSYAGIAQDVGNIILTKSWQQACVEDVLLFGSTMQGETHPNDIDMLILHSGHRLHEFGPEKYREREGWELHSDESVDKGGRVGTHFNLYRLGFRGPGEDGLGEYEWEKEQTERRENSVLSHVGRRLEPLGISVDDGEDLNTLLDLHVMSVGLLGSTKPVGRGTEEYIASRMGAYASSRQTAIENCRDPTFWHTVLSTGRLYDPGSHTFSIPVEDKYPNALDLFKVD